MDDHYNTMSWRTFRQDTYCWLNRHGDVHVLFSKCMYDFIYHNPSIINLIIMCNSIIYLKFCNYIDIHVQFYKSLRMGEPTTWDTDQPVQSQKQARSLMFRL